MERTTKKHCEPRKTIKCLLGLQLFWLFSSECKSPELPFGDEVNTDVTNKVRLEVNKPGLELSFYMLGN